MIKESSTNYNRLAVPSGQVVVVLVVGDTIRGSVVFTTGVVSEVGVVTGRRTAMYTCTRNPRVVNTSFYLVASIILLYIIGPVSYRCGFDQL